MTLDSAALASAWPLLVSRSHWMSRTSKRPPDKTSLECAEQLNPWAGRALPAPRGRGRIAISVTSLLLKAGADPIVRCEMAAGHHLRLDCRVPGHCWAFFSGKYDDEKRSALLSFLRPGGAALDVGANIGFYTIPMAAFARSIGARVVAIEPVAVNTQWLLHNLALNN